jgi:asparagine synthase (glutamine-hydrolysing)
MVDRAVALRTNHSALYRKGILAQWRVDQRDPTADLRLVEFCLATPPEQFLRDGQRSFLLRQAMAERLPPALLDERRKGLQALDWHRGLSADFERLRNEVERISRSPAAARAIDVARLRRMVDEWPDADWESAEVNTRYRQVVLRTISIGSFLAMCEGR